MSQDQALIDPGELPIAPRPNDVNSFILNALQNSSTYTGNQEPYSRVHQFSPFHPLNYPGKLEHRLPIVPYEPPNIPSLDKLQDRIPPSSGSPSPHWPPPSPQPRRTIIDDILTVIRGR